MTSRDEVVAFVDGAFQDSQWSVNCYDTKFSNLGRETKWYVWICPNDEKLYSRAFTLETENVGQLLRDLRERAQLWRLVETITQAAEARHT